MKKAGLASSESAREALENMEPASQDLADTVLERAIPDACPTGIPCVVIEVAQKRGDIKEVKSPTREQGRKDFQELVPFV